MNLEQAIIDAPGYQLVRRGATTRETVENVCAAGFAVMGDAVKEMDYVNMLVAASAFFPALLTQTEVITSEIFEGYGLEGGARGAGVLGDLKHLDTDAALDVARITATLHELGRIHEDIISEIEAAECCCPECGAPKNYLNEGECVCEECKDKPHD